MADKDVLEKNGADAASGNRANDDKKLTLESIMREYDAKKAAAEQKKEEHSESFEAFCREQENAALSDERIPDSEDAQEDYDDSDMKIAPDTSDGDIALVSDFSELPDTAPEAEGTAEGTEEKLDIMNAISRHYHDSREQPVQENEAEKTENEEPAENTCEGNCDLECPEGEVCVIEDGVKRCKPIDNETLKKAFGDDGDELFGGVKKKKKRSHDYSLDDGSDTEDASEKKPEKFSRYDENGERIERDSKFFSPVYEYTKECDPAAILSKLKIKLLGSCFAMAAVFFLLIASFYTEIAPSVGLPHFGALEPGKTGVVFMLFDLQLLFFAVIIKLNSFVRGAVGLFTKHKSAESVAFVSVLAAAIHTVALAVAAPYGKELLPVCSVACLSVLLLSINDFLRARTEFMSFRIISTDSDKYAFKDLSKTGETTPDEIVKYVPEGSTVLDIRKVSFVDDFFKRSTKAAPADKNVGVIILVSLIAAIAVSAVYCGIKGEPVYKAICAFASVFLTSVQSCMLLSTSLAESVFAERAARRKCAFIGHEITDDFENVSVISFKDTEVFPPKAIRVTNIRTYGSSRIDNVIVTMARVFGTVGGPLSTVFTNSLSGIDACTDNVKVVDVAPDGLWMKLDGENVYVGTASYMAANNFDTNLDAGDDGMRMGNNAILYLASSDSILAKFYIKYEINKSFEPVLRTLYTQNICARIKTLDPCISNDFIRATLRRPECLFSVVKGTEPEEVEKTEASISASMVSASGEGGLINSFLLIRKMKKTLRINLGLKAVSVAISFVIAALALLLGGALLPPAVILLIQLFWIVPVYLASKFALK